MPWNGSGTFVELSPPDFPAVSGQVITAAYFNTVIRDLIEGLNNCMLRDNQGGQGVGTTVLEDLVVEDLTVTGTVTVAALAVGIPRRIAGWATGECLAVSTNQTLNTSDMVQGHCFTVANLSAAAITISPGVGVTLRLAGTTLTGAVLLEPHAICSIWCNSGTEAYVAGAGVTMV